MSDWQEITLGEISSIEIGGTPSRSEERYWWKSDNDGIRLPWVSISDMKGRVITDTKESITEIGALQSNCKHVPKGTLLMSFKLTIGRLAFAGRDLYTNEAISAIRPTKDVHPEFLYYGLQHWNLTEDSDQAVKGVTLNKQKLQEIPCLLPPLPEQKKIAEILSGIDKAISTKKQARNDLEAAREAICGELIQNGDWSQEEIGNLTSHMTNGFVGTATPHYRERGIKYLTSKNIRRDRIDTNRMIYISEEFHMANQKSSLRVGDVLMVQSGHIGTTAVVTNDYKDCNCHALILMRFNQEHLHPEYASLYLNSATGKTRLSDIFVGSTIKHVNTGDLRKFKIPVPPLDVQRDIANRVRSIDILLGTRDLQIEKLVILKQAISSDLLSGRKRVSV